LFKLQENSIKIANHFLDNNITFTIYNIIYKNSKIKNIIIKIKY